MAMQWQKFVFVILKTECVYQYKPKTIAEANNLIDSDIHLYYYESNHN